jgi:plastocyanin
MKFFEPTIKWAKQGGLGVLLVVAGGVSLVACGDTAPPTPVAQPTTQATSAVSNPVNPTAVNPIQPKDANQVQVQLQEWSIVPAGLGIPTGPTSFVVVNNGEFAHNLVIKNGNTEVARTPNFTKAESPKTLDLDMKPGAYTWLCDIPGHADQGMKGTLTVGQFP